MPKKKTTKSYVVHKRIALMAKPAEVWDALTNPQKTKDYFFNCKVQSDWKAGSPITFKGRIFLIKKIELGGTILDIEPEKLLKYTIRNASDVNGTFSTVTDELEYTNGRTILTISDDVGQGEGAKERYEKSQKGWDKILKGLQKLVEDE